MSLSRFSDVKASQAAANVDPDTAHHAAGYDADRVLAEHLLHDCGEDTDLVRRYYSHDEIAAALTGR